MNIIGVIPSRYGSTRFPGKPLAMIRGKSMIRRVWEQAVKSDLLAAVFVATDDKRIYDHVKAFGGQVLLTSAQHKNGTSRCREVLDILNRAGGKGNIDAVINIQGDEPFIEPAQIDQLTWLFSEGKVEIGTLAKQISDPNELLNPNTVKVVTDKNGKALYFSRQALPFVRESDPVDWLRETAFLKHLGIYGYRSDVLKVITELEPGVLEEAEKLEQLRWLEHGIGITVALTTFESPSIDTPEDLSKLTNSIT